MTCIKTGADVYLDSHDATIHGDLYLVGRTYILTCGASLHDCMDHAPKRFNIRTTQQFECGSRVIAFDDNHAFQWSYDGKEIE